MPTWILPRNPSSTRLRFSSGALAAWYSCRNYFWNFDSEFWLDFLYHRPWIFSRISSKRFFWESSGVCSTNPPRVSSRNIPDPFFNFDEYLLEILQENALHNLQQFLLKILQKFSLGTLLLCLMEVSEELEVLWKLFVAIIFDFFVSVSQMFLLDPRYNVCRNLQKVIRSWRHPQRGIPRSKHQWSRPLKNN